MKKTKRRFFVTLILVPTFASLLFGQSGISTYKVRTRDETKKWVYPYKANEERTKQILKATKLAEHFYLTLQEVMERLGKPDVIEDLRKKFNGLSPEEDKMMARNRDKLTFRAIWYISKQGTLPNLKDTWIAIYVGADERNVRELLANNIQD